MRAILCPNCGAQLEIEDTQSHVTCPYCTVTSEVTEVKEQVEHYMLPVEYDVSQARTQLIGDILKYPGVPENLKSSLKFTKVELKYVPYWIITVANRTEYAGIGQYATFHFRYRSGYKQVQLHPKPEQGVFDDEREFIIYAGEELNVNLLNFEITTRGKRYFQKQEAEKINAEVIPSVFTISQAKDEAIRQIREIHKGLILKEITQIQSVRDNPQVKKIYLLHVPFYFFVFQVEGKNYRAILDAATGRTVITEVPRAIKYTISVISLVTINAIISILGLIFSLKAIIIPTAAGYMAIVELFFAILIGVAGLRARYSETRKRKERGLLAFK
ncbi:MAG: hypothetical protein ACTSYD_05585 [Candidatus Heimdallarchaeaceae archaeon]